MHEDSIRSDRSPAAREYRKWYKTARWKRISKQQKIREPYCRLCKERGVLTEAEVCDHVEPHRGDSRKFWSGPFQSLCRTCHDSVKQKYERTGTMPGCDRHGVPIDKEHPWHDG